MPVRRPAARVPRSLRPALPRVLARPAASVVSAAIPATIGGAAHAQDAADSGNDAEKSASEKNTQTMDTIVVEARMPAANPHADPQAPYKVDRLQSSKFTRPILDLSRSMLTGVWNDQGVPPGLGNPIFVDDAVDMIERSAKMDPHRGSLLFAWTDVHRGRPPRGGRRASVQCCARPRIRDSARIRRVDRTFRNSHSHTNRGKA